MSEVETRRGRPVELQIEDLGPAEPTGFWIATELMDWIVVPHSAGPAQREAIICHELSHILLGHRPPGYGDEFDALARQVAPHINPEVARRIMCRSGYTDELEAEAETLGTLLVTRLAGNAERHRLAHDAVSDRLR